MRKVINFMRSESFIFIAVLCVLTGQILHTSYLFKGLMRVDLSFNFMNYHVTAFNWLHAFICASAIEAAILMFLINGKKIAGQLYALASFAANILYYHYWDGSIPDIITSTLISAMLSGSIWFFSDLFAEKIFANDEKTKAVEKIEDKDNILPMASSDKGGSVRSYVGEKGI